MSIVKNIASKLGVSPSTVSLVLNNKPGISEATRQKVFTALHELGYKDYVPRAANVTKKNIQFVLYKKHGRVVDDTPFFSHLLQGVEAQARKSGLTLLISYINEEQGVEEQLRNILATGCRGMVLLATEMNYQDLIPFLSMGIPFLILDSYFENPPVDSVSINNVQGSSLATSHLCEAGHMHIGYLKSKIPINNFLERKEGYKKALKRFKRQYNPEWSFALSPTMDMAYQDMKEFLAQQQELPTAFFCDNDIIAVGAMKAIREAGYKIPQDISLVGFDNQPISEITDPPLTTIDVPKQEIGMIAVERLAAMMENPLSSNVKIEVSTRLVERGSVSQV